MRRRSDTPPPPSLPPTQGDDSAAGSSGSPRGADLDHRGPPGSAARHRTAATPGRGEGSSERVAATVQFIGPSARPRRCTDVCCLLLFAAYYAGMLAIGAFAHSHGDLKRMTHGFDWTGSICGVNDGVVNEPYLYWCKVGEGELSEPICVSDCPQGNLTQHRCPGRPRIEHRTQRALSPQDPEIRTVTITRELELRADVETKPFLKYCLPLRDRELVAKILALPVVSSHGRQAHLALNSVYQGRWFLLGAALAAASLSYVFLILVRRFVKTLIFILFAGTFLLLLSLGCWGLVAGLSQQTLTNALPEGVLADRLAKLQEDHPELNLLTAYLPPEEARRAALAFGGAFVGLAGLFLVFWCCASRAVGTACRGVAEACEVVERLPSVLLQPLIQICVQIACLGIIAFRLLLVASLGGVLTTTGPLDSGASLGLPVDVHGVGRTLQFTWEQYFLILYVLLGSVWIHEVVAASGQFAICYVVVVHRLAKREAACSCMLLRGYASGVFWHLGTLACGAFVTGALRILTLMAALLSRLSTKPNGEATWVGKLFVCGSLDFLRRVANLLNEMVYVDVLMFAHHYTEAVRNVWRRTIDNPVTASTVLGSVHGIKRIGVLFVTGIWTSCAYWIFSHPTEVSDLCDHGHRTLKDLGLTSGAADTVLQEIRLGLFTGSVTSMTAATGVICFLVSASIMNTFATTAQAVAYIEVCLLEEKRA